MSRYTVQLRFLLESDTWTDERLGLTDYPIFDEGYRDKLNNLIKEEFYFDEIAFETPARFAKKLRHRLNLIMPFYNEWYKSTLEQIEPFLNISHTSKQTTTIQEILNAIKNSVGDNTKTGISESSESGNGTIHDITLDDEGKNAKRDTSNVNDSVKNTLTNDAESGKNVSHETFEDVKSDNSIRVDESTKFNSSTGESTTESDSLAVTSDTPEGFLLTEKIENSTYANTATKNKDKSKTNEERTGNEENKTHGTSSSASAGNGKKDSKNLNEVNRGSNTLSTDSSSAKGSENLNDFGNKTILHDGITSSDKQGKVSSSDVIADIVNALENSIKNSDSESNGIFRGFNGITMSDMLIKWRDTFVNIDNMVLNELEGLFLGVLN